MLTIISEGQVKMQNTQFRNLSDYELDFIDGESIEVDFVEIDDIQGVAKLINQKNKAKTVQITNSQFKAVKTVSTFINGGTNGLTVRNVSANTIRLARDCPQMILMQSLTDTISNSTFESVNGASSFLLA